jgi:hypothetical protein
MDLLFTISSPRIARRRLSGLAGSVALHVAIAVLIALLPPPSPGAREPAPQTWGTASTFVVGPEALVAAPGDQVLVDEGTPPAAQGTEGGDLRIGAFHINIAKIRARRNWLFPFLTTDLLFLERGDETAGISSGTLLSPFASRPRTRNRPPLAIGDAELQAIVDRAWSRRERWTRFSEIAGLVNAHDADAGRLPELLHRYLDQNLLQPYYDAAIRDPRFWAMLDCVADHVEFIDWVRSFARQHPSTRTTTELLFLLDEFVQGSRDTLLMLLSTDADRDLKHTRSVDRAAHDFAVSLRRQYGEWLRQHQLEAPEQIRRRYDEVRLRLLSTIIESTPGGYRAADARYLAGEVLFNQNKMADALRMWGQIRPDRTDTYVVAYSDLLEEMRSPGGARAAEVNRILGAEYRRWLDYSKVRLGQFGYAFDTF